MDNVSRSIVTIAVGSDYYKCLAINLFKSFIYWNKENNISFQIITDDISFFNSRLNCEKLEVTTFYSEPNLALDSFATKFSLFDLALTDEVLFVDCDCIIYGDISEIFSRFGHVNFSVVGNEIYEGDFFCDVKKIIEIFDLKYLPKFVGSIYYFVKNDITKALFTKAIEVFLRYDELGLIRLRGKPNEEPIFAIAMACIGERPIMNDGRVKADVMYYNSHCANVLTGNTMLTDPICNTYGEIIPKNCSPLILHFPSTFSDSIIYKKDVFRKQNCAKYKIITELLIILKFTLLDYFSRCIKFCFRRVYRFVFGNRPIINNRK